MVAVSLHLLADIGKDAMQEEQEAMGCDVLDLIVSCKKDRNLEVMFHSTIKKPCLAASIDVR